MEKSNGWNILTDIFLYIFTYMNWVSLFSSSINVKIISSTCYIIRINIIVSLFTKLGVQIDKIFTNIMNICGNTLYIRLHFCNSLYKIIIFWDKCIGMGHPLQHELNTSGHIHQMKNISPYPNTPQFPIALQLRMELCESLPFQVKFWQD